MPEPSRLDLVVCPALLQLARLNLDEDVLGLGGPSAGVCLAVAALLADRNALGLVNVVARRVRRIQTEAF